MDDITPRVFHFERFTLDVMRRALRSCDRDVDLRPKSFDVLRCLVERAGQLVTKNEIIANVWPDVIVTDESVARCISDIRLALDDNDQRMIKTVHRRGYVFAAPVVQGSAHVFTATPRDIAGTLGSGQGGEGVAAPGPRRSPQPWQLWAAGCAVLLFIAGKAAIWFSRQPAGLPLPDRPSVAVLPLVNESGEPGQDYFSDGISEDLTTSLSKFAGLFVTARGSAFKFKGKEVDPKQIGHELGVRYLVEGSVRRDASRLRITTQLVEATTGLQLWAERYDREPTGVFAVQDDVTQRIVARLVASITRSELERATRKAPEALAAYDYYLQANALMKNMQFDKRGETTAAARALYERALAIDPHYAPAMQGLANTYLMAWLEPAPDHPIGGEFEQQATIDRAETIARRAVELDGTLAEVRATLGWILYWQNHVMEGTAEFERAFAFNPNFVDARFAVLLAHSGRAPEEIEYVKRIMRLDPFYPPQYTYLLGKGHFFIGRYEEAIKLIRPASARMPGYRPAPVLLAAAAAHLGREQEARAAAAEVLRIQPDFTIARWLKWLRLVRQEDINRVAEGLRKAGLPD